MKFKISKKLKWMTIRIVIYYFLLLIALYFFQSKILYSPFEAKKPYPGWTLVKNTPGATIAIEQTRIDGQAAKNIIIIFHGNAGSANDRISYKSIFPGSHIVIAEYPGFGMRYGQEFGKDKIIKEAGELVQKIKKDNPLAKIAILGESLGTGVASAIAQSTGIDKLILVTPYTNIADVAQNRFWFFPVKYLVMDNYDNVENMKAFRGDVLVVLASRDEVVPTQFGQALYESINKSGKKKMIIVEGASHNSWIMDIKTPDLKEMREFIQ